MKTHRAAAATIGQHGTTRRQPQHNGNRHVASRGLHQHDLVSDLAEGNFLRPVVPSSVGCEGSRCFVAVLSLLLLTRFRIVFIAK